MRESLPTGEQPPEPCIQYDPLMTMDELRKLWLESALEYFGGNKYQAAAALGVTVKTIYNWLDEFGIKERWLR